MKPRKIWWSFLAWFLLISVMVSQAQAQKIRVAMPGLSVGSLAFFVAQEKGYYEQESFETEMIVMSVPAATAALVAGEVDFITASTAGLSAALRGAPLVMVYSTFGKAQHELLARPGIKEVKDLKGKKVGVSRLGFLDAILLREELANYRLKAPGDVIVMAVGRPAHRYAALVSGSVDAVVLSPPHNIKAEEAGYRKLMSFRNMTLVAGSAVTPKPFVQANREVVKRFLRATVKGLLYIRGNRAGTIPLMMRTLDIDKSLAEKMYDAVQPTMTDGGTLTEEHQEQVMRFMRSFMGMDKTPPIKKFFDYSLAHEVRKELEAKGWKP